MAYHPGNREQETEYQGKSEIRWLLLTILVGFALRVYGIGPYHYHPDESDFIVRAMRFGTGDLNPHWFGHPGSIFMYLLFAIYGLCFILGQLSGSFSDWTSFGTLFQTDPIPFYVMGRTVNALFGTLTIPVVYLIARRIFNKPTGLVSSLLMTVSLLHTQFSKLVRTDILTTVFVLLAVLWAVYAYETRRHRDYALSGIFVGLATAAKYTSLAVVVPPLLAYLLDEGWENIKQPESLLSRKSFLGLLVVSALILLTGFLADVSRTSVLAASFISTDGVIEAFGLKFLRLFQIGLIALGTLGLATTAIAGLWRPFGNLVGGLLKDKKVILLLSCVFIGFAASTPFFFFELRTVYWNLIIEARGTQLGNESLSGLANYVWYITQPLNWGIGWPIEILAGIGVVVALFRSRERAQVMLLLSFPLPFFLFIGAGKLRWARWMIPMLPFLALFAGYCLCLLVDWGHRFFKLASRVRAGSLLVVVAVVVAFPSGYASARWGYQLAHKDTSEALPQTAELMAHGLTQIDTDRMSI